MAITWPARGQNGFGYDAIFTPLGHQQTFGEMDPSDKHAMSHRADALPNSSAMPAKAELEKLSAQSLCALAILSGKMPLL